MQQFSKFKYHYCFWTNLTPRMPSQCSDLRKGGGIFSVQFTWDQLGRMQKLVLDKNWVCYFAVSVYVSEVFPGPAFSFGHIKCEQLSIDSNDCLRCLHNLHLTLFPDSDTQKYKIICFSCSLLIKHVWLNGVQLLSTVRCNVAGRQSSPTDAGTWLPPPAPRYPHPLTCCQPAALSRHWA